MRLNLTKVVWILSPILIAAFIVGSIYSFNYSDADIVIKGSLTVATLAMGCLITVILMLFWLLSNSKKKALINQLAQQRKSSEDEHKRFVQRLDHELKNPLTTIQVSLENIKRNPLNASEDSIDNILDQTKRLSQLTNDLRKIALLDEQALEFEHMSVSELLTDLKEMFLDMEHGREIELILPAVPWPVPNINADRDLLELALYNIVENAIKYSNPGDRIEIRANDDRKFVKIEVADTGLGLETEELNQVWEELFRGSNVKERSGVGIGLSLVKKIVEQHKGTIEFDSKPNVGSRVSMCLPITSFD